MASAKASSQSSIGVSFPSEQFPKAETDRRMAMRLKAIEIKIQEVHSPVRRINLKAKNAAISWQVTATAWRETEAKKVKFIMRIKGDL